MIKLPERGDNAQIMPFILPCSYLSGKGTPWDHKPFVLILFLTLSSLQWCQRHSCIQPFLGWKVEINCGIVWIRGELLWIIWRFRNLNLFWNYGLARKDSEWIALRWYASISERADDHLVDRSLERFFPALVIHHPESLWFWIQQDRMPARLEASAWMCIRI